MRAKRVRIGMVAIMILLVAQLSYAVTASGDDDCHHTNFPSEASAEAVVDKSAMSHFRFKDLSFRYIGQVSHELTSCLATDTWLPFDSPTWQEVQAYSFAACTDQGKCTPYLIQVCDGGEQPFRDGQYGLDGFYVHINGQDGRVPFTGCDIGRIST